MQENMKYIIDKSNKNLVKNHTSPHKIRLLQPIIRQIINNGVWADMVEFEEIYRISLMDFM